MGTKVTITIGGDSPVPVAEFEVSGQTDGELRPADGPHVVTIGATGATIHFLTVKRVGNGDISLKAAGKVIFEADGDYKHPKKSNSFKFSKKNSRVLVREIPKK